MRKLLIAGVGLSLIALAAQAQTTTQSRTTGSNYKAVVMVPSTGNGLPSGTSSEALGMVLLNPATGAPYTSIPTTGGGAGGTGAASAQTQGAAASNTANTGNPVKVGCVYNSTAPIITSGNVVDCQASARGSQLVVPVDAVNGVLGKYSNDSDAVSIGLANNLSANTYNMVFNGTTWDRMRGSTVGLNILPTPTTVAANAIVASVSADASTSLIAKASAGNMYDAYARSTAAGLLIVYNSTTVPAAGALTPALVIECIPVVANGSGSVSYNGGPPERLGTGIVLLFSSATSCNTYTASATAYLHARVQ